MTPGLFITLFIIGLFSSFVGGLLSGITSMLSLGMMLLSGLPPQLAVSTYKFGILGSRIGGLREFWKAKKIEWRLVWPLCFCAFFGSLIGSSLLVHTDEKILSRISGVILTAFLILAIINPAAGIKRQNTGPLKSAFGYLLYFLMSIWCGFFPAGTGLIFLHIYLLLFGLTILEIKGTDKIPALFIDLAAIFVFLKYGIVHWEYVAAFLPGMVIGGILGAKAALKVGDRILKAIVIISAIAMVVMLFLKH